MYIQELYNKQNDVMNCNAGMVEQVEQRPSAHSTACVFSIASILSITLLVVHFCSYR